MGKVPSLYELACRAYNGTEMPDENYKDAFDDAMSGGEKPSLIIIRLASEIPQIPYNVPYDGYKIWNPYLWRIAYANETLFGLHGPLEDHRGKVTQVAVIKDWWENKWGGGLENPELYSCRSSPLHLRNDNVTEGESRTARMLYPDEIWRTFMDLYDPEEEQGPIEGCWFKDAELPLHVIDGVPESSHHSERRHQRMDKDEESYFCCLPSDREYLQDPNWKRGLVQEYKRIEGEQMEK